MNKSNLNSLLLFTIFGIVSGICCLAATEKLSGYFQISQELQDVPPDNEKRQPEVRAALSVANTQNACLVVGAIGALCSLASVIATGVSGQARRPVLPMVLTGVVGGGLIGTLAGLGGYKLGIWFDSLQSAEFTFDQRDMWAIYKTMLTHSAFWGTVGCSTGLMSALTARQPLSKAPVFGAVAGVVAACAYQFGAGILFQLNNSSSTFPSGTGNRLFWGLLCCLAIFAVIGKVLPEATAPAKNETAGTEPENPVKD